MTHKVGMLASISLVSTLCFGPLVARPDGHEQRQADVPPALGAAPPVLNEPKSLSGMNLDFTGGAKLGEVFLNLSKQSGVSIILHASASGHETATSADLRGMNFQRALDTLMLQNDLFYKVLDPTAIMVFKKTPQNLQEFETKFIKTFNLVHADVENVRMTLSSVMPQVRLFHDRRLNAITLLATPGDLAKAQQVVNNMDRSRGEVRLQMELVDVSQKASVAAGLLGRVETPANTVDPDRALARVMQDADSKLLASPEVRVVSGEYAEVRIGRKPGLTQTGGEARTTLDVATGKTESTWQMPPRDDLGVRIRVKPRLHPNHEITLEVEYEITDPLKAGEPGRPRISERVIKTSVRIKDGQTSVFGGLLKDEKCESAPERARGGKEQRDRLLAVKAVVVRWDEQ